MKKNVLHNPILTDIFFVKVKLIGQRLRFNLDENEIAFVNCRDTRDSYLYS